MSMLKLHLGTIFATVFVVGITALSSGPVLAARVSSINTNKTGNDISWPQCGKTLPVSQTFGIVGVTGGLATNTNSCLTDQLAWVRTSSGKSQQPKIQLYVNAANPGGLGTASWPKNNIDPAHRLSLNPYGRCDGSDTPACAWQYGWNRAFEDIQRFQPAAQMAGIFVDPATYPWWLDVETDSTWKSDSNGIKSNQADLEGMTAYFMTRGITVGLYSTAYQWGHIAGTVNVTSNLTGLNSWLAGATNQSGAQTLCSQPPLTPRGKVSLTQYISGSFDYDYSCP